jgi:hypothetical protein
MTDLITRLRSFGNEGFPVALEAADEITALRRQLRAAQTILEGADRRDIAHGAEVAALKTQASDVASERAANALLTEEIERLRAENDRLKTVPMKYRRMEFNAQLQAENERLRAEVAAARRACELALIVMTPNGSVPTPVEEPVIERLRAAQQGGPSEAEERAAYWLAEYGKLRDILEAQQRQSQGDSCVTRVSALVAMGRLSAGGPIAAATELLVAAAPQQRQPLSDEQINEIADNVSTGHDRFTFTRAVEAAHGIGEKQ